MEKKREKRQLLAAGGEKGRRRVGIKPEKTGRV
jgi:hypothetical protein